jgi:short-subunit dehydrogenase
MPFALNWLLGIRVTTVCPGLMRTGSHIRRIKGGQKKEFAWFSISAGMLSFR